MPPDAQIETERVRRLDRLPKGRQRSALVVGIVALLLAGGAGAWWWLQARGQRPAEHRRDPPPPAADNLLGDAWSFETTADGSGNTRWRQPEDAPAGFVLSGGAASSGELGAEAAPGPVGWCRWVSEQSVRLPPGATGVEIAATTAGGAAVGVRFEAEGRPALDLVGGVLPVPPGFSTLRVLLQSAGPGSVDDARLKFVSTGAPAPESRGLWDLVALDGQLLLSRAGSLVLHLGPLGSRDWPGTLASGADGLLLPGGGRAARSCELASDARRVRLSERLTGLPEGTRLLRELRLEGGLAEVPVGLVSLRGLERFTSDFEVEQVKAVVLGRTQDRLVLDLGASQRVEGSWRADGSVLLRLVREAAGDVELELALQTNVADERVQARQVLQAALEKRERGELGAAFVDLEHLLAELPYDDEVLEQAARARAELLAQAQSRLDAVDRDAEDALFLASAQRCREVLAACRAAELAYAGSEGVAVFQRRAEELQQGAARLLEEDRARRAGRVQRMEAGLAAAGGYEHVVAELAGYLERHLAAEPER